MLTSQSGEDGDEAARVPLAVDAPREAHDRDANSLEGERGLLGLAGIARALDGGVCLDGWTNGVGAGGAGGDDEGTVGPDEGGAEGFDGALGRLARLGEAGEVVNESTVNDAARGGCAGFEAREVGEVAAEDGCAGGDEGLGGSIRACEAGNGVTCCEKLLDDLPSDPSRRAGDEDVPMIHGRDADIEGERSRREEEQQAGGGICSPRPSLAWRCPAWRRVEGGGWRTCGGQSTLG